jgi:probable HAF family extracellular repeat protein
MGSAGRAELLYRVEDLGTLGGTSSFAYAMNARGQVVGWSNSGPGVGDSHAFLYDHGTMRDIGPGVAYGINDKGQVVGQMSTWYGALHAFEYWKGTCLDLGTLGGARSAANGVNASGQIVGWSDTANGDAHAFLRDGSKMVDLGTLGGHNSTALGINARGEIVGAAETPTGGLHAFIYRKGTMLDLGTLGGETSRAWSINDFGQVTGTMDASGVFPPDHGFLYAKAHVTDLGWMLYARGMNNEGDVVGSLGSSSAFLYEGGELTNLNSHLQGVSPLWLVWATAINECGQIAGYGTYRDDVGNVATHAYLLTRSVAAPEPPSLLITLVCVLGILSVKTLGALRSQSTRRGGSPASV